MSGCLQALNEHPQSEFKSNQFLNGAVGISLIILSIALLALDGYGCYRAFVDVGAELGFVAVFVSVLTVVLILVLPGFIMGGHMLIAACGHRQAELPADPYSNNNL